MSFLLGELVGDTIEFGAGAFDLVLDFCALMAIQLHHRARQAPVGATGDGGYHLQIAQQFADRGRRRHGFAVALRFAEQPGLGEQTLPDCGRRLPPRGVPLPRLATGKAMRRESFGHTRAVRRAGTRHRHQILHRHLCRDRAVAHLLLHAFRK